MNQRCTQSEACIKSIPIKGRRATGAEDGPLLCSYKLFVRQAAQNSDRGWHLSIRLGGVRCQGTRRSLVDDVQNSLFQVRRRINCRVVPSRLREAEQTVRCLSSIRTTRLLLIRIKSDVGRQAPSSCHSMLERKSYDSLRQTTNVDSI